MVRSVRLADKGLWPVAGGQGDQPAVWLDAWHLVQAEAGAIEAERWDREKQVRG